MTVTMKQGQEYKRRDGAMMIQNEGSCGGKWPWIGNDKVWRSNDGKSMNDGLPHDIISEWPSEPEGKTLADLDVRVGDVVYYDDPDMDGRGEDRVLSEPEASHAEWLSKEPFWHIVSRASDKDTAEDKPKWGPWLLWTGGEDWTAFEALGEVQTADDDAGDVVAYRKRKEPVKGTVTNYFRVENGNMVKSISNTHTITFDTIDGKPDCASIKMTEIDNA